MTMTKRMMHSVGFRKGYQMMDHNRSKIGSLVVTACLLSSQVASAQQQEIVLQEQIVSEANRQATLIYQVTDNELTTGIGFRVHFDSNKVHIRDIENHLESSNVGIQVMDDTDNLDSNPDTDSYINAAWVDLNGDWPAAATLPVKLYSFTFDAVAAEASDLFTISQSSIPVGFSFVSSIESIDVSIRASRLNMRGHP